MNFRTSTSTRATGESLADQRRKFVGQRFD
jgi:hypothetical protein